MKLYHINPETGRVNICKAQFPMGNCRFGSDKPHFTDRQDAVKFIEKTLEEENGLLNSLTKNSTNVNELDNKQESFTADELKGRLQLISEEALEQLILEDLKRSFSKSEAEEKLRNKEPFYVHYNRSQEITLDPEDYETQETFMKGACGVLAYEIHRATGWDIVSFNDRETSYWQGHIAIRTPSGGYLDIEGESHSEYGQFFNNRLYEQKTITVKELNKLLTHSEQPLTRNLGMLERYAASQIAFNLLESEGYVKD